MLAGAARVLLALTLVVAAVAKLRARDDARDGTGALVPAAVAPLVAGALPYVELALAALLLVWWSSPIPAVVAGVVILAFTVVVVRAQVRHLPCPCFGAASAARPAGALDVLRNGVLLALAVLATGT